MFDRDRTLGGQACHQGAVLSSVLLVHRNRAEASRLRSVLRNHIRVTDCTGAEEALRLEPRLMFVELLLPKSKGLDLIRRLKQRSPASEIIALSPVREPAYAVAAVKAGAFGFLTKEDGDEVILDLAHEALEHAELRRAATPPAGDAAVPLMDAAVRALETAKGAQHVLLVGEIGTGRKRLAQMVHRMTPQPGVLRFVDCSRTAAESLSSSFNLASPQEAPEGREPIDNTICLLNVEHLADKELRYLEELCRAPVWVRLAQQSCALVRYRIVGTCTTKGDAERCSCIDRMRAPPLEAACVQIPPLRERLEELPALWSTLAESCSKKLGVAQKTLSADALEVLSTYRWPGNLAELGNLIERLTLTCPHPVIDASMIPMELHIQGWKRGITYRSAMARLERELLLRILDKSDGCRRRAAERLRMSYSTLKFRLKKLGLSSSRAD